MVYYREGYVPQVYDQQVSTHLLPQKPQLGTAQGAPNNPRGSCPVGWGQSCPVWLGALGNCDCREQVGGPAVRKMSGFLLWGVIP